MGESAPLEIRLLGRFAVRRGSEEVPPSAFGGRLARTLVRVLVTRRGELVPREVLTEALWPERPPADPAYNLKILVSRARRALGDPSLIFAGPGGYALAADERCWIDTEFFTQGVEAGRRLLSGSRPTEALDAFLGSLAAYGGEPLPEDAYAEWSQEYRRELQRALVDALEGGASAALSAGDPREAAALAERAVAREPLRETGHLLLVEALAASGDRAGALRAYADFKELYAQELGLDPSPEAQDLELRVLRGEVPAAVEARITARPLPAAVHEKLAFVGRDDEVDVILRAAQRGGVITVSGHAGAGKTRLIAEAAARSPVVTLACRAFIPDRNEPWALARMLLREALLNDVRAASAITDREASVLADIVPEIEDLRSITPVPADPESRRALAVSGAAKILVAAAREGLLVLVDDLQWADATSLELISIAASQSEELSLLVAFRPEEIEPGSHVAGFLHSVEGKAERVDLGPLPDEAIFELVGHPSLAETIVRVTDRTPLTVEQILRTLSDRGALWPADGKWVVRGELDSKLVEDVVASGQRRAIEARLGPLSPSRREALTLLALLGRETPARTLADALEVDQAELFEILEGLGRTGLVRLGEQGWAVAHDLIGEHIGGAVPKPEAGRLHGLLARALEEEGADPAEIGRHHLGAGDGEAAASTFARGARERLDRFANREAATVADEGLRLEPSHLLRLDLLEVRAEARRRLGDLAGAREDLRAVVAGRPAGPGRSRALSGMAMLVSGSEDLSRAAELAALAAAEAGDDPSAGAEARFVAGVMAMNHGEFDDAERNFDEALRLFELGGDLRGAARITDVRGMQALLSGRIREGASLFGRAAELFLDAGDLVHALSPRSVESYSLCLLGEHERALDAAQQAFDLAQSLSQPEDECYALIMLSHARSALGDHAQAIEDGETARAIAEGIGHREWTSHALWILGDAYRRAGNLEEAEKVLRGALEFGRDMPMHQSMSASRLALALIERDRLGEVEALVATAKDEGLPITQFDARLAEAELLAANSQPGCRAFAAEALAQAEEAGHALSIPRLKELAAAKDR